MSYTLLTPKEECYLAWKWSANTFLTASFPFLSLSLPVTLSQIILPEQVPICHRAAEEPRVEVCKAPSSCLKASSAFSSWWGNLYQTHTAISPMYSPLSPHVLQGCGMLTWFMTRQSLLHGIFGQPTSVDTPVLHLGYTPSAFTLIAVLSIASSRPRVLQVPVLLSKAMGIHITTCMFNSRGRADECDVFEMVGMKLCFCVISLYWVIVFIFVTVAVKFCFIFN